MTDTIDRSVEALEAVRLDIDGQRMALAEKALLRAPAVMCTGVGKSLIVAQMAASLLRSVGVSAVAVHATDFLHGDVSFLPVVAYDEESVVMAFSHSGKTAEVAAVIKAANTRDIFSIAITSISSAVVGGQADVWLSYRDLLDGSKHGTIPTASVTAQLAYVNEIVCRIADRLDNEVLLDGHAAGSLGETYKARDER